MQQEHLRGANLSLVTPHRNKRKIGRAVTLGLSSAVGVIVFSGCAAHAAGPSITFGEVTTTGSNLIDASGEGTHVGRYYATLPITFTNTDTYSIYVHGDTELVGAEDSNNKIGTLAQDRSDATITEETSAWGYRAHFGAATETSGSIETVLGSKSYTGVKEETDRDVIIDGKYIPGGNYNGKITLEFVAAVDGDVASDEYAGDVYVSALATPLGTATIFDLSSMQEMTPDVCNNTPTPISNSTGYADNYETATSTANTSTETDSNGKYKTKVVPRKQNLSDERDSNSYTIVKLADGHCWMQENLKYAPEGKTLRPAETDVATEKSYSSIPNTLHIVGTSGDGVDYNGNHYYNWYSATAGSGASAGGTSTATESLCPANWKLPTGGNSSDFAMLKSAYSSVLPSNSTKSWGYPLEFPFSGYRRNVFSYGGSYGYYWSSASCDSTTAYNLSINNGDVTPVAYSLKSEDKLTVRCIAR